MSPLYQEEEVEGTAAAPAAAAADAVEAAPDAADEHQATELAESLAAMRQDLAEMERRRDELKVALAQAEREEEDAVKAQTAEDEEALEQEAAGLAECAAELLEILKDEDGSALDAEDMQSLLPLATALLSSPKVRAELPLPLVFRRMHPVLLLPAEGALPPVGEEPQPFMLTQAEVMGLISAKSAEVPLWLAEKILESAQGRLLDAEYVVVALAQRVELLQPVLRCGRFRVHNAPEGGLEDAEELAEEHLLAIGLSSKEASDAVLGEPRARSGLSTHARERLEAMEA